MSISKLSRRSRATTATPSPEWAMAKAEIERFDQMRDALPAPGDSSLAARVARAEYIVEMLSGHFIHKGWTESFDQGRAAEFVKNVRHGSTRKFYAAMEEGTRAVHRLAYDGGHPLPDYRVGDRQSRRETARHESPRRLTPASRSG
jgi:hypothetical protein